MEKKTKQKLASIFQKASQRDDYDTQILNTINSVLEKKNAGFRLGKENKAITVEKKESH